MTRLTDTQLVILNAAASRDSHSVLPLPRSLKINKGTATSVMKALFARKLVEERPAAAGSESWRQDKDGRKFTLVISEAGIAALDQGGDATPKKATAETTRSARSKRDRSRTSPKREKVASIDPGKKHAGGKLETILKLLQRPGGARLAELEKATGWQPHSVRAALTALRRRGVEIIRERNARETSYRAAKG